jgi:methanogenic corrinoid protein MtbC1
MSPRKIQGAKEVVDGSAWLIQNLDTVSRDVVALAVSKTSSIYAKYGERGRVKCYEDTVYHLHYLSEAVAGQSERLFLDYVGWAKIMLDARNIPAADFIANLKAIVKVIQRKAPAKIRRSLTTYVTSALAEFSSLPQSVPSYITNSNPLADLANDYLKLSLLLKHDDANQAILRRVEAGLRIRDLFEHVIYPVQQEIGRLWQENRITVIQEHYCTASTEMLIAQLRRKFKGTRREGTALALCPEGEQHCVAIKLFAQLLESDGWRVAYIGPNCPIRDVVAHFERSPTDLVAISVTTPLNLAKARKLIAELRGITSKVRPKVLAGGQALGSESQLSRRLAADGWARSIVDGLDLANRLLAKAT